MADCTAWATFAFVSFSGSDAATTAPSPFASAAHAVTLALSASMDWLTAMAAVLPEIVPSASTSAGPPVTPFADRNSP